MPEENKTEKKQRTVAVMKEKRTVPEHVKEKTKHFAKMKKTITEALKDGPKTVPQVAQQTNLPLHVTMYYVQSMVKFGLLSAGDVDDDDYYLYELITK